MTARKPKGGASAPSVSGGAAEVSATVETPDIQTKGGIGVVTTATGAGPRGIIPAGTEMTVDLEAYSSRWMRPKNEAEAKKLKHG